MPHIHQRKYHSHLHKVKRLHHNSRHGDYSKISNLPSNIIHENISDKTPKYIKYFDYPLPQLLVDHSTNPLQNTTRQYINQIINNSNEGRFKNHEMIIRRNGETTILRPRQDLVLANGFTPVIRPSSILPSYPSIIPHPEVSSTSASIMNKVSVKKTEQPKIIKPKRMDRHRKKRCDEKYIEPNNFSNHNINYSNQFEQNDPSKPNFINLFKQALHDMIEEKEYLPPPLMSVLPQFHHQYTQSFPTRLGETYFNQNLNQSPFFTEQLYPPLISNNRYNDSFYDNFPSEQYRSFEQINSPQQQQQQQHLCSNQRHYTHMSGYFYN